MVSDRCRHAPAQATVELLPSKPILSLMQLWKQVTLRVIAVVFEIN